MIQESVTVELPIDTYLKYFKQERITNASFTPLMEEDNIHKGRKYSTSYCVDYNKYDYHKRKELLFNFFSFNIGFTCEVGTIYGVSGTILGKSVFEIGGEITDSLVKPINILSNTFCYNYFEYGKIYYAKII